MTQELNQNRNAIIVLGMHRSGTSALMRLINLCGVDLGRNLMPPSTDNNERGFWENLDFYYKNEKLLKNLNSSWDDVVSLPSNWMDLKCTRRYKLEISRLIVNEFSYSPFWGIKDPRLSKFLPVWVPVLKKTGNKAHFIIIERNPLEVALSLSKRDGFSIEKSCLLWLTHLIEAEKGTRQSPRMFTTYKELLTDWKKVLDRAEKELNIQFPVRPMDVASQVEEYFTEDLYHNRVEDSVVIKDKNLSSMVRESYGSLQKAVNGDYSEFIRTLKKNDNKYKEAANLYEPLIKELSEKLAANNILLEEEKNKNLLHLNMRLANLHSNTENQASQIERDKILTNGEKTANFQDELNRSRNSAIFFEAQVSKLQTTVKENEDIIKNLTNDLESTRKRLSQTQESESFHQIDKKKLENRMKEMRDKIDAKKEKLKQLKIENEKLQSDYGLTQKKTVANQNELDAIFNSISWRITNPLRRISVPVSKLLQKFKSLRFKLNKEYRIIKKSGLFDSNYYLERYPDVGMDGLDPIEHFIIFGADEGRDPNPFFFTSYYKKKYKLEIDTGMNPLIHYILHGYNESKNPNPLFDSSFYIERYQQDQSSMNPLTHFIELGEKLGNKPHMNFDPKYYLESNPDVAKRGVNSLQHYLENGYKEGRIPYSLENFDIDSNIIELLKIQFNYPDSFYLDADFYRKIYPDLREHNDEMAKRHYEIYGCKEGRYRCFSEALNNLVEHSLEIPIDFSAKSYLELNPDVAARHNDDLQETLIHYLQTGCKEGRLYSFRQLYYSGVVPTPFNKDSSIEQLKAKKKLCVLVHIFNLSIWPELARYIHNLDRIPYDLHINIAESKWSEKVHKKIRAEFPESNIYISPNKGRDIGGFYALFSLINKEEYDICCLLHTKKSPHLSEVVSDKWRRDLLDAILENEIVAADNIEFFNRDSKVGIIGSSLWFHNQLMNNEKKFFELLSRMGIHNKNIRCAYLSGTIMFIRLKIIKEIFDVISYDEFESGDNIPLKSHIDGQLAHAIERVIGNVSLNLGYKMIWR